MQDKALEILLVEDNPGDIELVRESIEAGPPHAQLHIAQDGIEALAFLRREGTYVSCPKPDLIILDINLPRKSGHEVLAEIKGDPELGCCPVVVLTTSAHEDDVLTAYKHHANAYVEKPLSAGEFIDTVKAIRNFWAGLARLPSRVGDAHH